MAITFEQLDNLNLSALNRAVESWESTKRRSDELKHDVQSDVAAPFKAADWSSADDTSERAAKQVKHVEEEFDDAHNVSKAIHSVLKDTLDKLKKKRQELKSAVDEERSKGDVTISGRGEVTYKKDDASNPPSVLPSKNEETPRLREEKHRVQEVVDRIEKVLNEASEIDDSASAAIRYNIGNNQKDFHDRTDASTEGAENRYDAHQAVQLAQKGDDLTNKELTQLNQLLKEHNSDPKFANTFTTQLGAKGTLNFWQGMNPDRTDVPEERRKILAATRKGLGSTLGTATRSDSHSMERWKQDMIAQGDQRQGDPKGPYGFQVMSDLMQHGKYDEGFMLDYGEELVDFEQEQAKNGVDPKHLWAHSFDPDLPPSHEPPPIDKDDIHNRWWNDPMVGFTEGLGHNPDASTKFFNDSDNFDYLVGGGGKEDSDAEARAWPVGSLSYGDGAGKGYDALGHALESAVKGAPYDDPRGELDRGPEESAVMQKVVDAYGGEQALRESQPGISDSLGRMGAAYVDDLNYAMDDYMDGADKKNSDEVLGTTGRERIHPDSAFQFMHSVGSDKESHAIMSNAQEAFTASRVHSLEDPHQAQLAAEIGAMGHGALDEGRAEQLGADGQAKSEELKESANWKKEAAGIAVYGSTGAIGGIAGPVAPVAIPLLTGAGGSAMTSEINQALDDGVKSETSESASRTFDSIKDFDRAAELNATESARRRMDEDGVSPDERREKENGLSDAYRRGRDRSDGDNAR